VPIRLLFIDNPCQSPRVPAFSLVEDFAFLRSCFDNKVENEALTADTRGESDWSCYIRA
jgi:hypothetical protein